MPRVVVEQEFDHPMSDEEFAKMSARLDPCLHVRDAAWRRSYISSDRMRMTCEFDAPDADTVREACRSAGQTFVRVWTASVFAVEDYPDHKTRLDEIRARRKAKDHERA